MNCHLEMTAAPCTSWLSTRQEPRPADDPLVDFRQSAH